VKQPVSMAQENLKNRSDMPLVARVIATVVGVLLIVCGGLVFVAVAVRPIYWRAVWLGIGAGGLGADLLCGGIRGRWPAAPLFWLE
jgi:hypothetical protein